MTSLFSKRAQSVKPSPTLAISAKAAQLKQAGRDIISLSVGEPDFDTPEHIKVAAIDAIKAGDTNYTPVDGTPKLKAAIIHKFARDNQLTFSANEIIASTGAKQVIYNALQALLNEGDEVIIPAPYWVSYPDMVRLAGGTPVIAPTQIEQKFKLTATTLKQAITPNTKAIIVNSPSNPTGQSYNTKELRELTDLLKQHPNIWIISDDIYEPILWSKEPFVNPLMVEPQLRERTLIVNGVSKSYAMTGWRIGYAAGPSSLIQLMKKIQSQSTSNPNSIAQAASAAALTGDQSCVKMMCQAFQQRHDMLHQQLESIPGITPYKSTGTFYLFVDIRQAMQQKNINTDVEFASELLSNGVAVVPGSAFGCEGFMRLSFALSQDMLDKAVKRIAEFLRS